MKHLKDRVKEILTEARMEAQTEGERTVYLAIRLAMLEQETRTLSAKNKILRGKVDEHTR